jgi:hypothetical protein
MKGSRTASAAGSEVVSLRRDKFPNPFPSGNEFIILANGDRLPAGVKELNGDRIRLHGNLGKEGEFSLPLSSVSMIWMTTPEGVDRPNQLRRRLLSEKRSHDKVYLCNGEVIEGVVNSISGPNLQIESARKEVTVPLAKIAFIAFNSELLRIVRPRGIYGHLLTENGIRLTLVSAFLDGHEVRGKTLYGGEYSVPLNRIVSLSWLGGCAQYLSDLKPRSYQFRSYLEGFDWPYVADASASEGDLVLGGRVFEKGLGVHTASRLTYDIESNVIAFEATVGMDDVAGKEGSARVQVHLDGKPQKLGWDGLLTGAGKARNIRIATSGAKEITLVADFGDLGDVQGCVDWADARFIKNQK